MDVDETPVKVKREPQIAAPAEVDENDKENGGDAPKVLADAWWSPLLSSLEQRVAAP